MGQEGVLGRKSCRSWVSWACWGGRVLSGGMQPRLPAHWAAENWPETAFWASPGHGRRMLLWVGFLPFWTACGVLTASLHPTVTRAH